MAQQPNIEIDRAALPREDLPTAAPQRWKPVRPGELLGPEDVPRGGAFGRPGPDTGWGLRLVRSADFERGDRPDELGQVVATVAAARASGFGRAPVPEDIEVALILLGLRPHLLPVEVADRLAVERRRWLDHAAHEKVKGAGFLATLDPNALAHAPAEVVDGLRAEES